MIKDKAQKARVRWRCHRGMLELDIILMDFCDNHFDNLSEELKAIFEELLSCQDPDLFAWLMGHGEVTTEGFKEIVQLIKDRTRDKAL